MTWEPKVIQGHPSIELDPGPGVMQPHWRPWGIKYKATKTEPLVIHVCASCEQVSKILFLAGDRWLCVSCRAEGMGAPTTMVPIGGA